MFDQTGIDLTLALDRATATVSAVWTDALAPRDGPYQVYVDGRFYEATYATAIELPWPARGRMVVQVGAVDPGELAQDLTPALPAALGDGWDRTIPWYGGRYLAADGESVQATRLYRSAAPGGPVDYTTPLVELPLWAGARPLDGFGVGRFGRGGFGRSELAYRYPDGPLSSGTWTYGVKAVGTDGSEGPAAEQTITVNAPPRGPSDDGSGVRVWYEFDAGAGVPTIRWGLSPDDPNYTAPVEVEPGTIL